MTLPDIINDLLRVIRSKIVSLIIDYHRHTIHIDIHGIESSLYKLVVITFRIDPDRAYKLALAFGTAALLLNRGRVVALGAPRDVLTRENLGRVYGLDVHGWMRSMLAQWEE